MASRCSWLFRLAETWPGICCLPPVCQTLPVVVVAEAELLGGAATLKSIISMIQKFLKVLKNLHRLWRLVYDVSVDLIISPKCSVGILVRT